MLKITKEGLDLNTGTLKQILLMTDGCSNYGENPVQVANLAFKQGITVNVIGILENNENLGKKGINEVEAIAKAGGGISQVVYKEDLSKTVQMVTQQAMTGTIQGIVNKQLSDIFGKEQSLTEIDPEKRGEVMEVIEDLGETCHLEVLILVDTSASMHHKLQTVKEALIDLSISLHARTGENSFAIYQFPGKRQHVEKVQDWSPELDSISTVFPKLTSGGVTPTGPAIKEAIYEFSQMSVKESLLNENEEEIDEEKFWY